MIRRMGWGKPVDENNHKKQLSTQPIYTVASLSAHSNKLGRVPENYHLACGYNSAVLELENINRSVHKLVTIKFQTLCTKLIQWSLYNPDTINNLLKPINYVGLNMS